MKKTVKTLMAAAMVICMTGGLIGCNAASASKAGDQTSSAIGQSDTSIPSVADSTEESAVATSAASDFEKEVEKLREAKDDAARDALVLTQLDIKSKRMTDSAYLYTITNTSNYSLKKVRFYFSPVVDGRVLLEGREIGDYDVIDGESLLYNYSYLVREFLAGSTVRIKVEFCLSPLDRDMSTIPEVINTEQPQMIHFELSDMMVTDKEYNTEYEYVELANLKYDAVEGVSYTLENKSDRMLFPTAEILFLKDGKPVDLSCYISTLEPKQTLEVTHNAPTSGRPEYDEIKTFIVCE